MVFSVPRDASQVQADRIISETLRNEARQFPQSPREFTARPFERVKSEFITLPPNPRHPDVVSETLKNYSRVTDEEVESVCGSVSYSRRLDIDSLSKIKIQPKSLRPPFIVPADATVSVSYRPEAVSGSIPGTSAGLIGWRSGAAGKEVKRKPRTTGDIVKYAEKFQMTVGTNPFSNKI